MADEQKSTVVIGIAAAKKDIPPTKDQQAKEDTLILDCVEDDDVRESLECLHAREEPTTTSQA